MLKGKVKWFNAKKGFGFIKSEDGSEIFVHYSQILSEGYRSLKQDQDVTFEITESDKGQQAANVSVVQ